MTKTTTLPVHVVAISGSGGLAVDVSTFANRQAALDELRKRFEHELESSETTVSDDALIDELRNNGNEIELVECSIPMPTVSLIDVRDPDSASDHIVFVNGHRVDAEYDDVDPGRGYGREDWNDNIRFAREDTSDYGVALLEALQENATSKYITGDDPRESSYWPEPDEILTRNRDEPVPATHWFFQTPDQWAAVAGETEADWFDDEGFIPAKPYPTPRTYPIDQVPAFGVAIWRDDRGRAWQFTISAEGAS